MRLNYKPIGDYVNLVEERNKELQDLPLIGLSITKQFIPSIANTIGTDMSTYRTIYKNQFAYSAVTSRNGDKLTIALFKDLEKGLISQAYTPFEITDTNKLLPEYLMMWFSRPEFDRYARFKSHGSARELFSWEDLCQSLMPIPSIDKQKEIVAEYNTIQNRIGLNKQLIQKLEETAQAIYKNWFVDFEFPDENGKPYKSNGGEMVESELGEVPKGWEVKLYEAVMDFKTGKLNSEDAVLDGKYPFFTCSNETFKTNTFSFDCEAVILAGNNASAIYPLKYFVGKFDAYQRTYVIRSKYKFLSNQQIFFAIKNELETFKGISSGTATKFLTMEILNSLQIIIGDEKTCSRFHLIICKIFTELKVKEDENIFLENLKSLLFSKLATIEN